MLVITGPGSLALSSISPDHVSFIWSLPKAELHVHLNGCIPLALLQDLATSFSYDPLALELAMSSADVQAGLEKLQTAVILDKINDFFSFSLLSML